MSYRTGPALGDCLAALARSTAVAEIIVVDNGNRRAESAVLDALSGPRIRVLRPGRNIGFAAGCNLGAAQASSGIVAFVNPDLIVSPGGFAAVLDALASHPNAWLCGGRLLDMAGGEQRGGRRETLTPWRALVEAMRLDSLFPNHPHFRRFNHVGGPPITDVAEVPAISGAFMVMPKARFHELGGMDEDMFLHIEDVDLCLRVLRRGGKILYCGNAPVYHHGGSSDAARGFVEWHKTRGTVRYFFKHFTHAYPRWALRLVSLALWVRFAVVALRALPWDAVRLARRLVVR